VKEGQSDAECSKDLPSMLDTKTSVTSPRILVIMTDFLFYLHGFC
jgi:hypothetical protein